MSTRSASFSLISSWPPSWVRTTLARLPDALSGTSAELYHTVHDEIELYCLPEEKEYVTESLRRTMVEGFLEVFPEGELVTHGLVEAHSGGNWAEVH